MRTSPCPLLVTLLIVFLFCAAVIPARGEVRYDFTDLGATLMGSSGAVAINNHGQIIGYTSGVYSGTRVFLYSGGTFTELGSPFGGRDALPTDINDSGQVVGYGITADNTSHRAFLYSNGTITDLGSLGGVQTYAMGINDHGQIVGRSTISTDPFAPVHGFMYAGGTMTDLGAGTFDALETTFSAINNSGQILGSILTRDRSRYIVLYSGGQITDLGNSGATKINDRGQIVGAVYTDNGYATHATISENGRTIDLGTLGGRYSQARGINESGVVVGESQFVEGSTDYHAFVYDGGTMIDLNTLVDTHSLFTLVDATAINDHGQIVGYALDWSMRGHAFLLTPIPEPSTAAILIAGCAGTLLRRRLYVCRKSVG